MTLNPSVGGIGDDKTQKKVKEYDHVAQLKYAKVARLQLAYGHYTPQINLVLIPTL